MMRGPFDNPNSTDQDDQPSERGCPRGEDGNFCGPRCDPYIGCVRMSANSNGCGCCIIHCECSSEYDPRDY